jgi:UDP-glucose 4-epimerase
MLNLFANIEEWFIPHFKKIMPNSLFIKNLSPLSIIDIEDELTLFMGIDNLVNFTDLGSFADLLLISIHEKKIRKIIFFSSYCVYNPLSLPFSENDKISPKNFIGAKSAVIENSISYLSYKFDIPTVILRLFNIYGPLQSTDYIIPHILEATINDKPLKIGNLRNIRDFLYIDDFINLIQILNLQEFKGLEVYNIGSGIGISIQEIITIAQHVLDIKKEVIFDAYKLREEYDYELAVANISKLKNILNWEPKIDIEDGIKLTYQWVLGKLLNHV